MKFCVTKRPTTLQISPTKRKRQGPTKQQEKEFRTSRAPTVKRPVLERPAGISAQNCLNARGEWDHFIYSESAYIAVVTLNCPCCNGKCVPKLNGINRMIDERSHEPRLDQDSRLWILSHVCFGVSVWWMRSFYLFWIGLSNCCDAELSSL